jgi:hypothetical protein
MVWRLIYTNTYVIDLFETSDVTVTPYNIFEALTQEECFNLIDSNKLFFVYPISETQSILFENGVRTIINN